MALYFNLRYLIKALGNIRVSKIMSLRILRKSISYEVDALDVFTSQLSQRKSDKWSAQKAAQKFANETNAILVRENVFCHDIQHKSLHTINSLFQDAIEVGDNCMIIDLSRQCIQHRICPSLSNLIHILTIYAQNGNKIGIIEIKNLCEECQPKVVKANSHFRHYLAEAIWIKGNIRESLKLFKEVYKENAYLRRRIRLTFKYLIPDVVTNRSEAALVSIVQFSEELLKNYKDYYPLTCVWQVCFLSEWFTDQSLSMQLLERNDGLCKAILNRIPYVVTISLRSHRTEVVYRLLEILLKYEMKLQCSGVLFSLLDYEIRRGDLLRSYEIIQWSVGNDVHLPTIHHGNFFNLLLNYNMDIYNLKEKWEVVQKPKYDPSFKF